MRQPPSHYEVTVKRGSQTGKYLTAREGNGDHDADRKCIGTCFRLEKILGYPYVESKTWFQGFSYLLMRIKEPQGCPLHFLPDLPRYLALRKTFCLISTPSAQAPNLELMLDDASSLMMD